MLFNRCSSTTCKTRSYFVVGSFQAKHHEAFLGIFLLNSLAMLYGSNATASKWAEQISHHLIPSSIIVAIKFGLTAVTFLPFVLKSLVSENQEAEKGIALSALELAFWLALGLIAQSMGGPRTSATDAILLGLTVITDISVACFQFIGLHGANSFFNVNRSQLFPFWKYLQ